jgi:hypothetical protein
LPREYLGRGFANAVLDQCVVITPLLLAFAPQSLQPRPGQTFRLVTNNALANGVRCVKIERHVPADSSIDVLWIDHNRGDLVILWEHRLSGELSSVISLAYRPDETWGWIPSSWDIDSAQPGEDNVSLKFRVEKCAISKSIPRTLFALDRSPQAVAFDKASLVLPKRGMNLREWAFPSAETLKTLQVLDGPVNYSIGLQAFGQTLEFMRRQYGIPFVIDREAFQSIGQNPSAVELSNQKQGLKLRDVFDRLLAKCPKPLTYEIRGGVLTFRPPK